MTLTTMTAFHLHDVTKKFGRTTALDAVTCDIPFGHVHGLIGRNGVGKTTQLRTLAGQIRVSGTLTLGDASGAASQVWDNPGVHDHLVLAGADVPYPSDMSVRTLMDIAAARWTTWDEPFATDQVDRFGVDPKARFSTLSRGQKTLASLVIGLGVRA
ncbi:ATP-binding cassette domain-containing protein [Corynebacterium variabile]|uniref:ATP-binding cassette domain-containing protein n=1 Tax=Corynebacterium variabile TaxID=1727 RepID=UPI0028A1DA4D|nr:ATP-binding cassette domain-containing protein [Corynebacterium variabile]